MKIETRKSSKTFVVSAELGMVAGIILAFYFVPGTTSAQTFWTIVVLFVIALNCFLFVRVKER
jgi:hypothetical protein